MSSGGTSDSAPTAGVHSAGIRSTPVLSIEAVGLSYRAAGRTTQAIDQISLQVREGEFISIVGPSGCGKSSLLKIVHGLVPPSAGRLQVAGSDVKGPRPDVGMVFQTAVLLPWRSVLENMMLPADVLRLDRNALRGRAMQLLAMAGLQGFENAYPDQLSGGMQQRASIVRALVHDPRLLLMDEPFSALDAFTREQMTLELQRIWMESHKTVLFVTHSIAEAVLLSDRIVLMSARPGRVIGVYENSERRPRSFDDLAAPSLAALARTIRDGLNQSLASMDAGR